MAQLDLHLSPQIERFTTAAFSSEKDSNAKKVRNRFHNNLKDEANTTSGSNLVAGDSINSNETKDKEEKYKSVLKEQEQKQQEEAGTIHLSATVVENNRKTRPSGLEPHTFHPRTSSLDLMQEDSPLNSSEFRGFFHLVIVMMAFYLLTTQGVDLLCKGTVIGFHNLRMTFSRFDLLPAWLAEVTFSLSPVFLQKLIVRGWIRPAGFTAVTLHIFLLSTLFGGVTYLAVERSWPITQTCFFLAEMFLLLMKMHSYIVTNRELALQYENHKKQGDSKEEAAVEVSKEATSGVISNPEGDVQLESPGKQQLVLYPANVTWSNYLFFLMAPTLVYELNYPRTKRIRVKYVLEKMAGFIGLWSIIHVIMHQSVLPVLEKSQQMSMWQSVALLIFPSMITYLLLFFIVFEVICNGFAELTRFADREFYQDWWNSTNFDEFARKWNRPVHEWLLRHVYLESIKSYKLKKVNAAMLTFLISSILHEYFMGVVLRLFRPYLFFIQMAQLPLIQLGRTVKGRRAGNYLFWAGLLVGPPLLSILYAREYFLAHS